MFISEGGTTEREFKLVPSGSHLAISAASCKLKPSYNSEPISTAVRVDNELKILGLVHWINGDTPGIF